jgi:hypothetical protein
MSRGYENYCALRAVKGVLKYVAMSFWLSNGRARPQRYNNAISLPSINTASAYIYTIYQDLYEI